MKLIVTDYCPFCLRCILALKQKGIKFEISKVDLTKKAEFAEQLSPYGRVPVLKHDSRTVFESSVISEYLDDVHPEPALLPKRPLLARYGAVLDRFLQYAIHARLFQSSQNTSRQ